MILVFYRRVSVTWRQQGSIIEQTIWQFRSVGGTITALYSFYRALLSLVVASLLYVFFVVGDPCAYPTISPNMFHCLPNIAMCVIASDPTLTLVSLRVMGQNAEREDCSSIIVR